MIMPTEQELRLLLGEIIEEVSGWSRDPLDPLDTDHLIAEWKRRGEPLYRHDPDWVIAPASTLQEWMEEMSLSVRALAALGVDLRKVNDLAEASAVVNRAVDMVQEVLDRKPLTEQHAELLYACTGIPVRMWLALEHNYRVGLAAGKPDVA